MSDVPERGRPETRTNVLPDFFFRRLGSGRSFNRSRQALRAFRNFRKIEELFAFRLFATVPDAAESGRFGRLRPMEGSFLGIATFHFVNCREVTVGLSIFGRKRSAVSKARMARSAVPASHATPRLKWASGNDGAS